jgi:hypothetical protein
MAPPGFLFFGLHVEKKLLWLHLDFSFLDFKMKKTFMAPPGFLFFGLQDEIFFGGIHVGLLCVFFWTS